MIRIDLYFRMFRKGFIPATRWTFVPAILVLLLLRSLLPVPPFLLCTLVQRVGQFLESMHQVHSEIPLGLMSCLDGF